MDSDTLNHWRRTIKKILTNLAAIPFPEVVTMSAKTVFDESAGVFLVVVEGWKDVRRLHGCLVYVEIKGDKIGVQQDGTEHGVVTEEGRQEGLQEGQAKGEKIGMIHLCERLLHRPETPTEKLAGLSLEELSRLSQELHEQILKTREDD